MHIDLAKTQPAEADALVEHDEIARSEQSRAQWVRDAADRGEAFSIRVDGVLAGYAVVNRAFYHRLFLALLYVWPNRRGQGVGTWVLGHLKESLEEPFYTSTNMSNTGMLHLLRNCGFVYAGVIYHLDPGDPEMVFCQ